MGLSHQADGSRIERAGVVVGSSLLGQDFTDVRHFKSRPSGSEYAGGMSGGSNLYASNEDQQGALAERQSACRGQQGRRRARRRPDRVGERARPTHLAGERAGSGTTRGERERLG